ncbi:MAG: hypothetical protein ACFCVK_19880 [Acidimicrobiales bacterium]
MTGNTLWIVVTVALLVVFGALAFATGNGIWWSVFGILVAVFGVYWWVVRPALAKRVG